MPRKLTPHTKLENLKKEAKSWLQALREHNPEALHRFERAYPNAPGHPVLRHVQHALAREHGFENWKELKLALSTPASGGDASQDPGRKLWPHTGGDYQQAAETFVNAYEGDAAALDRLKAVLVDQLKASGVEPPTF